MNSNNSSLSHRRIRSLHLNQQNYPHHHLPPINLLHQHQLPVKNHRPPPPLGWNSLLEIRSELLPEVSHKLIVLRPSVERRLLEGELLRKRRLLLLSIVVGTCSKEGRIVGIREFVSVICTKTTCVLCAAATIVHCVTVDTAGSTSIAEGSRETSCSCSRATRWAVGCGVWIGGELWKEERTGEGERHRAVRLEHYHNMVFIRC